tara:strand:- start:196 stop:333 length:138 start_codon:yes stop_codon:yes gene_type:complete
MRLDAMLAVQSGQLALAHEGRTSDTTNSRHRQLAEEWRDERMVLF